VLDLATVINIQTEATLDEMDLKTRKEKTEKDEDLIS